jgi:hypothetical protein
MVKSLLEAETHISVWTNVQNPANDDLWTWLVYSHLVYRHPDDGKYKQSCL